ncbi:MAG TPA: GGDEF domain-containing protein [Acidimicrobiales bacterium]
MGVTMSDRLSRLGYVKARQLLIVTGLLVLAVVALVAYARGVDDVEVAGTLLFLPIFVAFVFRGVAGGILSALVAIAIYAALRSPAIDAVGASEFTGLLASRSAAYLIFGAVGGWATQVLEGSLTKLELYDEVDDETGLYNARHLLQQTDLEMARAKRYETLFSVVLLDLPVSAFASMRSRQRRALMRDLGRQLGEGVRTVDHVVHVRHGDLHRFAVILPETSPEGAEVFRHRFDERVRAYIVQRGVALPPGPAATAVTFPGDDGALAGIRDEFAAIDAALHR